jgi:glycosyltransferase
MNLYIFNELSRASVYGIGTYIGELAAAFRNGLININIVHLNSEKKQIQIEKKDNVQHWHFPSTVTKQLTNDSKNRKDLYYKNIVYLLRLYIVDKKDLIFQLNYNHSGKLCDKLRVAFTCRVIAVAHYSQWGFTVFDNLQLLRRILSKEYADDFGKNLKESFEEEKLLYSKMDRVICLSNYMHEILCLDYNLDPEKITVIPNGLSDMAKKAPAIQELRKKWKISSKEKIILFVGRMDEIKGLTYLIKSFRELLKTHPECRLVIAGDGIYKQYAKESQDICTRVVYTGMLDRTQLYEWYRMAYVGVIPSLFEPFGYVAVEMMMHKLPVIATATSGLNEVVDDYCGIKVPIMELPNRIEIDVMFLTEKILYLLQHPKIARKMGKKGREKYLKEYSSEVFHRNMLQFYESLYKL